MPKLLEESEILRAIRRRRKPILQVDTHAATIYSVAAIQELHQLVKAKDAALAKAIVEAVHDFDSSLIFFSVFFPLSGAIIIPAMVPIAAPAIKPLNTFSAVFMM